MKKLTAAAALLTLSAGPAFAQMDAQQNNPSGPYVGVGWGQLNLDIGNLDDVGTAASDIVEADENAWKIFAGYRLNPYIAFEAAYIDLGKSNGRFATGGQDGNYDLDISGFAPYVIGTLPLGAFEIFGKVGYYIYDVNLSVDFDNTSQGLESDHSRSDFLYGGGVGFTFFDHLHLRAEYEAVKIENASSSDAIWLAGAWRF
jgi:outer membrane immunogenic protein